MSLKECLLLKDLNIKFIDERLNDDKENIEVRKYTSSAESLKCKEQVDMALLASVKKKFDQFLKEGEEKHEEKLQKAVREVKIETLDVEM